jgi:Domain of unknown function (DU1801)
MSGPVAEGNLVGYNGAVLGQLKPLRQLILDTANATAGVGSLEESTKWGEPSYAPVKRAIGSSVRLAPRRDGKVSMNFICHTGLIARFRELYPAVLEYEGNRTIVIDAQKPLPLDELRHCIALALTYHLNKGGDSRTPA